MIFIGKDLIRADIGERFEDKKPFADPRMRQSERRVRQAQIPAIEKIQIEGARSVELVLWRSSQFDFDVLESGEEIERRDPGGEFDGGVKESRGTVRAIHGDGFVDFGAEERAGPIVEGEESPSALLQVGEAVAEVRSQSDSGSHGCCFEFHRQSPLVRQFLSINVLFRVPETGEHLSGSRRGW